MLDEPEVVEPEVEVVAEADELLSTGGVRAVKRGFWRFGRGKSDEACCRFGCGRVGRSDEFEVAAEVDEPLVVESEVEVVAEADEPEVVESEVEVVAEADEFAVDVRSPRR